MTQIPTANEKENRNDFAFLGDFIEIKNVVIPTKIILVTPDLAMKWMQNNYPDNRKIGVDKINRYAQLMIDGNWVIGEELMFDCEENLIDGQHRLLAVIKAKKDIPFRVSIGHTPKVIPTLDRGQKRTFAQVCQLAGLQWVTNDHVSTFNSLFYCLPDSHKRASSFNDFEKMNAINVIKDCFETAFYKKGSARKAKSASVFGVIVRAFYSEKVRNKELLKDFLLLLYGFNYTEHAKLFCQTKHNSMPVVQLREKILSGDWVNKGKSQSLRNEIAFYTQNALDMFLENKKTRSNAVLKMSTDNLFPISWIDDLTFNK